MLPLPDYDLGRPEKLKIALVSGIARGLYKEGDVVVGAAGAQAGGACPIRSSSSPSGQEEEDGSFGFLQAEGVSAGVMDALIELAVSIGVEGLGGAAGGRAVRGRRLEHGDGEIAPADAQPVPGLLGRREEHHEPGRPPRAARVRGAGRRVHRARGRRGRRGRPLPELRRGEGAGRAAGARRAPHGGRRDLARHRGDRDRRLADVWLRARVPPRQGRARAGPPNAAIERESTAGDLPGSELPDTMA